ncbi:MAG: hypothetical protein COT39_04295 [Parcubacteria group bacterium CG08_land_8_20_14_0_20_48_21]|nr:MAG: hypothetical protein AUK21_02510 [Parcubacteria group bacterium CG2_30_48_51]PIS32495.1 MAG: hypothetical protein COT39_04295 [Parcubacteria group bacterium CG08_land_8_20_14_0_20_48_21]PIW78843.1 MAG: hypothetical protein COZ99_04365 [Parcubacteria group bacterium CG_4_8_14_3_um_filter_48_16]PIY78016.1 MAG: hypothetical protein COY83_02245 [Parcubacteria group bacterium CG_4_10_14_0_8_um_filter_48_154]PIZ77133.1 MAG: hypothetical protein COY03_03975 [bacterium CG_4_10_14_0_2_um_filter_
MALAEMNYLHLIALTKDRDRVMDLLQKMGVVEIVSEQTGKESARETRDGEIKDLGYWLAQITFAIRFLTPYAQDKRSPVEKLLHPAISTTEEELNELLKNYPHQDLTIRCEQYEEERNTLTNTVRSLEERVAILRKWERLPFAPQSGTQSTLVILGTLPQPIIAQAQAEMRHLPHYFFSGDEEDKQVPIAIVCKKETAQHIQSILHTHGWKPIAFAEEDSAEIPSRQIPVLEQNIRALTSQLNHQIRELTKIADELPKLKIVSDVLRWKYEQELQHPNLHYTHYTFTIAGWIPARAVKHLEKALDKLTLHSFALTTRKPKQDELAPSVLENKRFIQPYETVTNMYGAPLATDPDPTVFLAPFFTLFFALALTDAGYGIVITLITLLALKFLPLSPGGRKMMQLLMACGLATIVTGALFGSWFGMVAGNLPGWMARFIRSVQAIDPVADPNTFLLIAFGLGVVQIITGIAIKMWWKWKTVSARDALLDEGLWLLFLIVLIGYGVASRGAGTAFVQWCKWTAIGLTLALIATQGRKIKNPVGKIGKGILSLYNVVGYFSDVLSYSRLVALGLATGIIATVVNLVAALFRDMIPYVGWVVYIVILVGGHSFNLMINALGAFIHTARLHFVEYFPKFLEGAGKKFVPFMREARYISLEERE